MKREFEVKQTPSVRDAGAACCAEKVRTCELRGFGGVSHSESAERRRGVS